jgi:phage terminase large subunit-like protein
MTAIAVQNAETGLTFIGRQLRLPSGQTFGESFAADPWVEHDVLRPILAQDEDGLPLSRLAWLETHRGSGKTTIAGAIAVEEAVQHPLTYVYAIASDTEQAGLLLEAIDGFCRQNALLTRAARRTASAFTFSNGSRIRVMSSDAPSFYGLGVGCRRLRIIADEVGQWPKRDLFDAALSTMPKIRDSQLVVLTNAGIKGTWQEEARGSFDYLYAPPGIVASWIRSEDLERLRASMPDVVYRRYFENEWVGAESQFVPLEAWDACSVRRLPALDQRTPVVVGVDAAVSGDSFAIVAVTRSVSQPLDGVAVRACQIWVPPRGGLDFALPWAWLEDFCAAHNVCQVCYDPYQLHDFATRFMREHGVWCEPFDQGQDRLKADSQLLQLILSRRLEHTGEPELREHIGNASLRISVREDSKGRLVKSLPSKKIDGVVALSMAASRCLYLRLENAMPRAS